MISVLDALMRRLQAAQDRGGNPEMQESLSTPMPPGLPLVVQDALRRHRGYGEGEIMAPEPNYNPAFNEEPWRAPGSPEKRETPLMFDRSEALMIPNTSMPRNPWERDMPEGGIWSSRPSNVSPFASPLNQLMTLGRKAPLAMY